MGVKVRDSYKSLHLCRKRCCLETEHDHQVAILSVSGTTYRRHVYRTYVSHTEEKSEFLFQLSGPMLKSDTKWLYGVRVVSV